MPRKSNEIRRISVALDSATYNILQELASEKNTTVSDIVRSAIDTYYEFTNNSNMDVDKLMKYGELIYGGENVIVDIELWACILDVVNEKSSDKIWGQIKRIGTEYGIQFKNRGLKDVEEILNYLEMVNWFRLKTNGSQNYTLILRTRNVEKILKVFLENMFDAMGIHIDIVEGLRKLIIVKKDCKS